MNNFCQRHIFKIHNFWGQNIFEPNVLKWFIKTIFFNSSSFALLIINVKTFPIFKRNGAHLVEKKMFEKNKDCPFLRSECFEHVKTFLICVKF